MENAKSLDWVDKATGFASIAGGVGSIINMGLSLFSGIENMRAQREEARAMASALREEKNFNIGVLRQLAIDQKWSDIMSQWRSGLSVVGGTSAQAIVENNQNVINREINFRSSMYNRQIANAEAAADRRFLGIF